jgi:hypothetical protein
MSIARLELRLDHEAKKLGENRRPFCYDLHLDSRFPRNVRSSARWSGAQHACHPYRSKTDR